MAGVGEVPPDVGVKGKRLAWARKEQGLSLRTVNRKGGPSISYQSEVENGGKWEPRAPMLAKWVGILGVTVEFARGLTPDQGDYKAAAGQAIHVVDMLAQGRSLDEWRAMWASARVSELLKLITLDGYGLPRIVLAWVLGLELQVLDNTIEGGSPIADQLFEALSAITTLPIAFIKYGMLDSANDVDPYRPAVLLASAKRMPPEDLCELVRRWEPPAAGSDRTAGDAPGSDSL